MIVSAVSASPLELMLKNSGCQEGRGTETALETNMIPAGFLFVCFVFSLFVCLFVLYLSGNVCSIT